MHDQLNDGRSSARSRLRDDFNREGLGRSLSASRWVTHRDKDRHFQPGKPQQDVYAERTTAPCARLSGAVSVRFDR